MSTPETPLFAPPSPGSAPPLEIEPTRFPVFRLRDVLLTAAAAVFAFVLCSVGLGIAVFAMHAKFESLGKDLKFILGIQGATYALTLVFVHRMLVRHYRTPFFEGVGWRWPGGWWRFPALGAVLSVGVQAGLSRLPMPGKMPIDELFKTPANAWMMTIFGVLAAPFFEELFFRGLLFPALLRKAGLLAAVLATSAGFALIHADQLGKNWAPVLGIFVVGVALTLVRYKADSLAASVLAHMGYNGFLFVSALAQTGGFRHMEKLTQ